MLEFKNLPYIVNKQIVRCFFDNTWSINRKLAFLGVCHGLRQIALPMMYSTLYVRECTIYDHAPVEQWRLPSPSGRLWDLNVAPFNAYDVARFAKRIRIIVFSHDGFEELRSTLEYITSLDTCGWKGICKLDFWITGVHLGGDNSYGFTQYSQSLSAYISGVFSGVTKLRVFTLSTASLFKPFIVQLTTSYSVHLQSLSMSFPVVFSNPIQLQNVTVLDLKLNGQNCQLLSFVNPQILRKLYLTGAAGIYLWKYFSPLTNSDNHLNFAMLAELDIEANSDPVNLDERSFAESAFTTQYQRLCKNWEHDISKRKILLPSLEILQIEGGHFGDLLFKNCTFPSHIDTLRLRNFAGLVVYDSWIIRHVLARCVYIYIESEIDDYQYIPESEKVLGPGLGSKISNLIINLSLKINPAAVDLSLLQTLDIKSIYFSTLTALIGRFPSLCQLSIGNLDGDGSFENGVLDNDKIIAEPFSLTIVALRIERISSTFRELTSFYIKCLAIGLPKLRVVTLERECAGILKAFVLDNRDKYPHFRALFSYISVV